MTTSFFNDTKLVCFDFWETLYIDDPALESARDRTRVEMMRAFCHDRGAAFSPDAFFQKYSQAVEDCRHHARQTPYRTYGVSDIVMKTVALCGIDPAGKDVYADIDGLTERIDLICLDYPPVVAEGALETVSRISETCFLAVISNTECCTSGRTLRRLMARDGMLRFFGKFSFSNEVGIAKPNPDIFNLTLKYFGLEPGQAVHIGDNYTADYCGARLAGFQPVHFGKAPESVAGEAIVSAASHRDILDMWVKP